jgi:hypothetical protein
VADQIWEDRVSDAATAVQLSGGRNTSKRIIAGKRGVLNLIGAAAVDVFILNPSSHLPRCLQS